jgi:hypothetical protein
MVSFEEYKFWCQTCMEWKTVWKEDSAPLKCREGIHHQVIKNSVMVVVSDRAQDVESILSVVEMAVLSVMDEQLPPEMRGFGRAIIQTAANFVRAHCYNHHLLTYAGQSIATVTEIEQQQLALNQNVLQSMVSHIPIYPLDHTSTTRTPTVTFSYLTSGERRIWAESRRNYGLQLDFVSNELPPLPTSIQHRSFIPLGSWNPLLRLPRRIGFSYERPASSKRVYVRQRNILKDNCKVCLDPTTQRTWCCNQPMHQKCIQEWVDSDPLYPCPQKCGGLTCPNLKLVLRKKL